jgi:hypothetical protein
LPPAPAGAKFYRPPPPSSHSMPFSQRSLPPLFFDARSPSPRLHLADCLQPPPAPFLWCPPPLATCLLCTTPPTLSPALLSIAPDPLTVLMLRGRRLHRCCRPAPWPLGRRRGRCCCHFRRPAPRPWRQLVCGGCFDAYREVQLSRPPSLPPLSLTITSPLPPFIALLLIRHVNAGQAPIDIHNASPSPLLLHVSDV